MHLFNNVSMVEESVTCVCVCVLCVLVKHVSVFMQMLEILVIVGASTFSIHGLLYVFISYY